MKRKISMILAILLLVGIVPVNIYAEAVGTTVNMEDLPYIGDISKCKMSVKQAKAYISVLEATEKQTTNEEGDKYDQDYAILMDVSGDGIPLLLTMKWATGYNEDDYTIDSQLWGYQRGKAVKFSLPYSSTALVIWKKNPYLCSTDIQARLDFGDESHLKLYQVTNGTILPVHTLTNAGNECSKQMVNQLKAKGWVMKIVCDDEVMMELYTIDGKPVSKEVYDENLNEVNYLVSHCDNSDWVGNWNYENGNDNSMYKVLTKDSISQTVDLLTTWLPSLSAYDKITSAVQNKSTLLIDGARVSMQAYSIDDNSFIKLRDLAKLLIGTKKQFDVNWDDTDKTIHLISGLAYTEIGGELATDSTKSTTATLSTSPVYINGEVVKLTAYTINRNNYFKLRDLGMAFDFGVDWDESTNTIHIDTSTGYHE